MGMNKKWGWFQRTAADMKPRPSSYARLVDKMSRSCGHTSGKVAGQRATVKAEMNEFTSGLDRRSPSR